FMTAHPPRRAGSPVATALQVHDIRLPCFRKRPLVISCQLPGEAVSSYSLMSCMKIGKRLCKNFGFFFLAVCVRRLFKAKVDRILLKMPVRLGLMARSIVESASIGGKAAVTFPTR